MDNLNTHLDTSDGLNMNVWTVVILVFIYYIEAELRSAWIDSTHTKIDAEAITNALFAVTIKCLTIHEKKSCSCLAFRLENFYLSASVVWQHNIA